MMIPQLRHERWAVRGLLWRVAWRDFFGGTVSRVLSSCWSWKPIFSYNGLIRLYPIKSDYIPLNQIFLKKIRRYLILIWFNGIQWKDIMGLVEYRWIHQDIVTGFLDPAGWPTFREPKTGKTGRFIYWSGSWIGAFYWNSILGFLLLEFHTIFFWWTCYWHVKWLERREPRKRERERGVLKSSLVTHFPSIDDLGS
jgi:hypothetical protein